MARRMFPSAVLVPIRLPACRACWYVMSGSLTSVAPLGTVVLSRLGDHQVNEFLAPKRLDDYGTTSRFLRHEAADRFGLIQGQPLQLGPQPAQGIVIIVGHVVAAVLVAELVDEQ